MSDFSRLFGSDPTQQNADVRLPSTLLRYIGISPESQPGFKVDLNDERVSIDVWFAGTLNIEMHFSE